MYCGKCGTEITGAGKFCPKCGAEILDTPKTDVIKEIVQEECNEVQEYKLKDNEIEKLSESFVSMDEKFIASLGNGYIMNYLANQSVGNGFAFITDKRVYFKGSCLSGTGKKLTRSDEERTVDIKNITGSGFIHYRPIGIVIMGILLMIASISLMLVSPLLQPIIFIPVSLAGMIPSIFILKNYSLERKTLFRIEYAGGCIAFNVSLYAKTEIDDFQKQMRRTKDLAEESSSKITTRESLVNSSAQNSVPDDLRKYADLLKEGLISQEEYDAMKKKILNL